MKSKFVMTAMAAVLLVAGAVVGSEINGANAASPFATCSEVVAALAEKPEGALTQLVTTEETVELVFNIPAGNNGNGNNGNNGDGNNGNGNNGDGNNGNGNGNNGDGNNGNGNGNNGDGNNGNGNGNNGDGNNGVRRQFRGMLPLNGHGCQDPALVSVIRSARLVQEGMDRSNCINLRETTESAITRRETPDQNEVFFLPKAHAFEDWNESEPPPGAPIVFDIALAEAVLLEHCAGAE